MRKLGISFVLGLVAVFRRCKLRGINGPPGFESHPSSTVGDSMFHNAVSG